MNTLHNLLLAFFPFFFRFSSCLLTCLHGILQFAHKLGFFPAATICRILFPVVFHDCLDLILVNKPFDNGLLGKGYQVGNKIVEG